MESIGQGTYSYKDEWDGLYLRFRNIHLNDYLYYKTERCAAVKE